MICEKCGEPIAQHALYCENCGARVAPREAPVSADVPREAEGERHAAPKDEASPAEEAAQESAAHREVPWPEGAQEAEKSPLEKPEDGAQKKRRGRRKKEQAPAEPIPPEDLVPLTTAQCVGVLLAFCVPVLNLILMLKWAYAARGNESRRSLARAGLILTGVCICAAIAALAVFTFAVSMGLVSVGGVV